MAPPLPPTTDPERFGRLETDVKHMMEMIRELKEDVRDFRDEIDEKLEAQRGVLDDHAKQIAESSGRRQSLLIVVGLVAPLVCSIIAAAVGALVARHGL